MQNVYQNLKPGANSHFLDTCVKKICVLIFPIREYTNFIAALFPYTQRIHNYAEYVCGSTEKRNS